MIAEIYPDMHPGNLEQYFLERSILCPRNVDVDEFNTTVDSFSGKRGSITVLILLMRMSRHTIPYRISSIH